MGEFDLIARIRERCTSRRDVLLGIGDDAALLQVPPCQALCVSMDTLIAGVHFPYETAASDVGWKALAVNLSDLAAMGAKPLWATLALSLPTPDERWLEGFLDGFFELAEREGVALVGGDTTRGPMSITVTIHGAVLPEHALRRDAARVGDVIAVSGTLGDAAAGLRALQQSSAAHQRPELRVRLDRPTPRLALARHLAGRAHAAIDVSDGLLADLGHVLVASRVGASLQLDALPTSQAMRQSVPDAVERHSLQCEGGDDYELLFTLSEAEWLSLQPEAERQGWQVTAIGRVEAATGLRLSLAGHPVDPPTRTGWDHFGAAS
ncbi:MAG TPA: thiamine-phosphate kinase [Aquimonas sp.]|nr:thiamine-phosphate kinase [Xanthomonadales bacterium]HRD72215.1 thiamine-phosphate kinase [Aquimonas sp.]HRF54978.1 thiamine-phosphate kinase [Aquimonas sp.]